MAYSAWLQAQFLTRAAGCEVYIAYIREWSWATFCNATSGTEQNVEEKSVLYFQVSDVLEMWAYLSGSLS